MFCVVVVVNCKLQRKLLHVINATLQVVTELNTVNFVFLKALEIF